MKVNEVPQDESYLTNDAIEIQYAVDDNGNYVEVKSTGWKPKTDVLINEWDKINKMAETALLLIKKGEKSPIYYYMVKNIMDVKLLAAYIHLSKRKVKQHFKPKYYKKLSKEILQKYAEIFKLESIDDLVNFYEIHNI